MHFSARAARFGLTSGFLALTALASSPIASFADEGGVSFWLPGLYGSLAAVPQQQPGWALMTGYYHTSVSAKGDVVRAKEITIGKFPLGLSATVNAKVDAKVNLGLFNASYAFATPVLGGQASLGLMGLYGRNNTTLNDSLNGALTLPGGATIPFSRSDSFSDTTWGFADLYPQAALRWNAGVHNYMVYIAGDIPVGAYSSTRLANIGIGHAAIDAGGGYTYFNPQTLYEFSAVLGFTGNFKNTETQYTNGVDLHLDWGASKFLSKQLQAGLVGYLYKEIGCDGGAGDRLGCFRSQVAGVGPQVGYIFPVGNMQGYLNLKGYAEFAGENRPSGWNTWVTFVLSPAPPSAEAPLATRRPIISK